ncbi:hypothetical protein QAD02_007853 [Eretmocerus hayati]|uniref:Uncharacterized protein n=1 Tax=Eretmocerus hayati TaxID=131215 RepID=A0ACC2N679_9HYME|nr:hypothetical protein QAD02_007853 [Eretmocerus hayati]
MISTVSEEEHCEERGDPLKIARDSKRYGDRSGVSSSENATSDTDMNEGKGDSFETNNLQISEINTKRQRKLVRERLKRSRERKRLQRTNIDKWCFMCRHNHETSKKWMKCNHCDSAKADLACLEKENIQEFVCSKCKKGRTKRGKE